MPEQSLAGEASARRHHCAGPSRLDKVRSVKADPTSTTPGQNPLQHSFKQLTITEVTEDTLSQAAGRARRVNSSVPEA